MVDNLAITAGSGTTIATDEVGGVHTQRVKVCSGADGTVTDVSTAAPLPASLTNLEKAEDAAHSTGDKGIMALGVVTTDFDGTSATDEDYAALRLNSSGAQLIQNMPHTAGGLSIANNIDVDETEDAIKASAGQLYTLFLGNRTASLRYVRLYNDTVANVVVGTTAPVMTIVLQASSSLFMEFPTGVAFSAAITIAATTGVADNDTGAPGANDVVAIAGYK